MFACDLTGVRDAEKLTCRVVVSVVRSPDRDSAAGGYVNCGVCMVRIRLTPR